MRFRERLGYASKPRPQGEVLWFHAASVGEVLSLVSLIEKFKELYPDIHYLLTTGTKTSARIAEEYLGSLCLHQYLPYDAPSYVKRFLHHWKPSKCFLVESELWPFLLHFTHKMCPIFLLNARLSEKSYQRWKRFSWVFKKIVSYLTHIWAPSLQTQKRFQDLGASSVSLTPPLKLFSKPLPYDQAVLTEIQNNRPKWLAVSTHPDEEELCLRVHQKSNVSNLQTWIAPRHIERIETIEKSVKEAGLTVCRYSNYQENTDVVLIDAIGKMGLFYALCSAVFVGGSFCNRGGHNPLEPLLYGCKTFWGPDMSNFQDLLPFLPYDGTCKNEEDLMVGIQNRPQHDTPFSYEDSLKNLAEKMMNFIPF